MRKALPAKLRAAIRSYKHITRRFVLCRSNVEFNVVYDCACMELGETEDFLHQKALMTILSLADKRDIGGLAKLAAKDF